MTQFYIQNFGFNLSMHVKIALYTRSLQVISSSSILSRNVFKIVTDYIASLVSVERRRTLSINLNSTYFEKEMIFKISRGFCETGSFVIRTSSSSSCPFHTLQLPSGRIDLIGLENRAKVNCARPLWDLESLWETAPLEKSRRVTLVEF